MHILFVFAAFVAPAHADSPASSAARRPDQNYFAYLDDVRRSAAAARGPRGKATRDASVAERATAYVGESALRPAPAWDTDEDLARRFRLVRDARTLFSPVLPEFARRATWLYPEDGCFVRATTVVNILSEAEPSAAPPAKIYVFGNLSVRSPYARIGTAYWWYHVAPLVRVGERAFVLDPSIEPARPLGVDEWIRRQTTRPDSTQVAICAAGAYTPNDRCDGPPDGLERRRPLDERRFLKLEWDRLLELGRDPVAELGEKPPWG